MGNGCYAQQQPLLGRWREVDQGKFSYELGEFCARVSALPDGTLWRHNQAGDLPGKGNAIDATALGQLVTANGLKRGFTYTHKPMTAANQAAVANANAAGFTINLSGNNLAHADKLASLNIAPVVTVLSSEYARKERRGEWTETLDEYRQRIATLPALVTPAGRKVAVCPAVYLDTCCKDCGLCARQERKVIVGFPGHGASKRAVDTIAKE